MRPKCLDNNGVAALSGLFDFLAKTVLTFGDVSSAQYDTSDKVSVKQTIQKQRCPFGRDQG